MRRPSRRPAIWILLFALSLSFVSVAFEGEQPTQPSENNPSAPQPPQKLVDDAMPLMDGELIKVPASGNLQTAINRSKCGDTIEVVAGATYTGAFKLPNKNCSGWVAIRSSATAQLPLARRVSPDDRTLLAKIVTAENGTAAVAAAPGAHHYRLMGLEITTAASTLTYNLVELGLKHPPTGMPHHIVVDRCYVHGRPDLDVQRGVAANGPHIAVVNSYISDIHWQGIDTQAIGAWNSPGPLKISNNYLEAAGENVMFGGAGPALPDIVASDVEIRHNYFFKPLSWKRDHPSYQGRHWSVKNLFEIKSARRVLVEGNIFENNWNDGQTGVAIVLTPRFESGRAAEAVVDDLIFQYNVIRHAGGGITLAGFDNTDPTRRVRAHRILIAHNVFEDIQKKGWGGDGRLFLLFGPSDLTIDHNIGSASHSVMVMDRRLPAMRFRFTNNLVANGMYGVMCDGGPFGARCLDMATSGWEFRRNVILEAQGRAASEYPKGNFFAGSWNVLKIVSDEKGSYTVELPAKYRKAGTDDRDIGPNFDALNAAIDGVISRGGRK